MGIRKYMDDKNDAWLMFELFQLIISIMERVYILSTNCVKPTWKSNKNDTLRYIAVYKLSISIIKKLSK